MSDDLVKRFRMLQGVLDHGCSDGGCVIEVTKGQHTNGGCKCLYHPTNFTLNRVGHMLRCAQDMAACIENLEAKLAEAMEAIDGLLAILPDDEGPEIDYARTTIASLKGDKS